MVDHWILLGIRWQQDPMSRLCYTGYVLFFWHLMCFLSCSVLLWLELLALLCAAACLASLQSYMLWQIRMEQQKKIFVGFRDTSSVDIITLRKVMVRYQNLLEELWPSVVLKHLWSMFYRQKMQNVVYACLHTRRGWSCGSFLVVTISIVPALTSGCT